VNFPGVPKTFMLLPLPKAAQSWLPSSSFFFFFGGQYLAPCTLEHDKAHVHGTPG